MIGDLIAWVYQDGMFRRLDDSEVQTHPEFSRKLDRRILELFRLG